jgi:AraC family transcriptional activator of pobA
MIPHYFLYEDEAPKVEPSFLHIEPIPVRSGRHSWTIRTHTHPDHHQILVISKRGGAIEVEGVIWELSPPALVIIPALTIHAIRFKPGTDGYVITVAPPFLQSALDGDPDLIDGFRVPVRFLPQQIGDDIDLVGLFASLEHEFAWSAPGRRTAIKAYLQLLAVAARRLLEQECARPVSTARDADTVMRFRELVEKHFRKHPPLDFYARKLGVTTARLNGCCRITAGADQRPAAHRSQAQPRLFRYDGKRDRGRTSLCGSGLIQPVLLPQCWTSARPLPRQPVTRREPRGQHMKAFAASILLDSIKYRGSKPNHIKCFPNQSWCLPLISNGCSPRGRAHKIAEVFACQGGR